MRLRIYVYLFMALLTFTNSAVADGDGWAVSVNSASPEKCLLTFTSVNAENENRSAVSVFNLIQYDGAKPLIKTSVMIIPDFKNGGEVDDMVTNKPATSYYVDNNAETDDALALLGQLKTGKRLFLKYNDVVFVMPLKGFSWGHDLCGQLVKGK